MLEREARAVAVVAIQVGNAGDFNQGLVEMRRWAHSRAPWRAEATGHHCHMCTPSPQCALCGRHFLRHPFLQMFFYLYTLGCGHNKSKCQKRALC